MLTQKWEERKLFSFWSVSVQVTCVACCPIAQCAAVGTASGNMLFVDLKRKQQPRLVHRIHLSHSVDHLVQVSQFPGVSFTLSKHMLQKQSVFFSCVCVCVFNSFDQGGHYLFTGASDSHIFILNAKPSERFSVIGYTGRHCLKCF